MLALERIASGPDQIVATSRFYQTPCFPAGSGPDYVNAAALITTHDMPEILLARLHNIEAEFGRERVERWGRRTLDIDLVAIGNRVLPSGSTFLEWANLAPDSQRIRAPDQLILPHPRMHERGFVLIPLADIAPKWIHPVLGRTVAEMVDALPEIEKSGIIAL